MLFQWYGARGGSPEGGLACNPYCSRVIIPCNPTVPLRGCFADPFGALIALATQVARVGDGGLMPPRLKTFAEHMVGAILPLALLGTLRGELPLRAQVLIRPSGPYFASSRLRAGRPVVVVLCKPSAPSALAAGVLRGPLRGASGDPPLPFRERSAGMRTLLRSGKEGVATVGLRPPSQRHIIMRGLPGSGKEEIATSSAALAVRPSSPLRSASGVLREDGRGRCGLAPEERRGASRMPARPIAMTQMPCCLLTFSLNWLYFHMMNCVFT
jgi:hypothetical protein